MSTAAVINPAMPPTPYDFSLNYNQYQPQSQQQYQQYQQMQNNPQQMWNGSAVHGCADGRTS
jgi:uncharacterized protein YukE